NCCDDDFPDASNDHLIVTRYGKYVPAFTKAPPPSPVSSRPSIGLTQEDIAKIHEWLGEVENSRQHIGRP
ncbi:MAG: hypothetical protein NT128_01380, partial [Proteobacteria bacterium]|nr:hypothetical protein [Pseudomonadota bacterium]